MEWKTIDSAPEEGVFLVWLAEPLLGSQVQTARWHPNVKTIGAVFHFDAPKPTHWMPLPEPPK